MTEREFNKLKLADRYNLLKQEGEFVASRIYEGFHVHLFTLQGSYVEMWMRIGLEQVVWIELMKNKQTLDFYTKDFDPKKDLGL
jgi:hypothetical protein